MLTAMTQVPRVLWGRKRSGVAVRPWAGPATGGRGAAVLSENRKWFGLVGTRCDRKQEVGKSS